MVLEENDTYSPFYIAMGVIAPLFFLMCLGCNLSTDSDGGCTKPLSTAFVLTCKVFDWMSDWAFYAISLQSPRFTEQSIFGFYRDDTFERIQKASLAFCIIGTFLVISEWYGIGYVRENTELFGMNNHQIRANIGLLVILFEDIPQLTLCGVYLGGMYTNTEDAGGVDITDDGFQISDDPLTGLSIILSSFSFAYNCITVVRQRRKGGDERYFALFPPSKWLLRCCHAFCSSEGYKSAP